VVWPCSGEENNPNVAFQRSGAPVLRQWFSVEAVSQAMRPPAAGAHSSTDELVTYNCCDSIVGKISHGRVSEKPSQRPGEVIP
jgi:hypothetical protein